jgi:hypothetical protein
VLTASPPEYVGVIVVLSCRWFEGLVGRVLLSLVCDVRVRMS